jgi:hypothetical protein
VKKRQPKRAKTPKKKRKSRRRQTPAGQDWVLAQALVKGARIDLGDVVLSTPDVAPLYLERVAFVDQLLEYDVPEDLTFDPGVDLEDHVLARGGGSNWVR